MNWPKALQGANLSESPVFSSEIINFSMDKKKKKKPQDFNLLKVTEVNGRTWSLLDFLTFYNHKTPKSK